MKRKRTPSPNRNCYFGKPAEFQLSFGLGFRVKKPPKKKRNWTGWPCNEEERRIEG